MATDGWSPISHSPLLPFLAHRPAPFLLRTDAPLTAQKVDLMAQQKIIPFAARLLSRTGLQICQRGNRTWRSQTAGSEEEQNPPLIRCNKPPDLLSYTAHTIFTIMNKAEILRVKKEKNPLATHNTALTHT